MKENKLKSLLRISILLISITSIHSPSYYNYAQPHQQSEDSKVNYTTLCHYPQTHYNGSTLFFKLKKESCVPCASLGSQSPEDKHLLRLWGALAGTKLQSVAKCHNPLVLFIPHQTAISSWESKNCTNKPSSSQSLTSTSGRFHFYNTKVLAHALQHSSRDWKNKCIGYNL